MCGVQECIEAAVTDLQDKLEFALCDGPYVDII
jgi:hypothetical protein